MKVIFRAARLFLIVYLFLGRAEANALEGGGNRLMKLTLIPDYLNGLIRFDGQIDMGDAAKSLDWQGLPLIVEHQWKEEESPVWTVTGRIRDGKLEHGSEKAPYQLILEEIHLQPGDRLSLVVP